MPRNLRRTLSKVSLNFFGISGEVLNSSLSFHKTASQSINHFSELGEEAVEQPDSKFWAAIEFWGQSQTEWWHDQFRIDPAIRIVVNLETL